MSSRRATRSASISRTPNSFLNTSSSGSNSFFTSTSHRPAGVDKYALRRGAERVSTFRVIFDMQSYPGSPPPIRPWDDEGPVAEVTIWIPKTQIAEGHWMTVPIWARVSKDVHPCAEVHYDNGVGVDGVIVRYKNSKSDKWQKIVAETARGVKGKARVRRVKLGGKGYRFHRLVANAFYDMPIRSPAKVCHIVDREKDKHPNDAAANIYVGTDATNKADRDSTGVPKPGKSIPFEGKRPGDELWTRFESQKEAAGVTGVKHGTVTAALRNGSSNTGPDE